MRSITVPQLFFATIIGTLTLLPLGGESAQLPVPQAPQWPTSNEQCQAVSDQWSEISREINQQHSVCLQSSACKQSNSNYRGVCSCGACHNLHVIMDRYSNGDLAQHRRAQLQECRQKVATHQEEQRQQRHAAEEAQRRQQQAYRDSQMQQQNWQRDEQRRQQAIGDAQQRERQRQLQERQTNLNQAREQYDSARNTQNQLNNMVNSIQAIFGSGSTRRDAATNLANDNSSTLAQRLGETIVPRRNNHQDPTFNTIFDTTKETTVERDPRRTPVIGVIQDIAAGALRSQLNQTLGDLESVSSQISNFTVDTESSRSAPTPTPFSVYRSTPMSQYSRSDAETSLAAVDNASAQIHDQRQETAANNLSTQPVNEVDTIREALNVALSQTYPSGSSQDARQEGCNFLSRPGRGRHSHGQNVCHSGQMRICENGQWRSVGRCSEFANWQALRSENLESGRN